MKTEYLGTLFSAIAVLLIATFWTLCIMVERNRTKAPDAPPEYYQRDAFAVMGGLIVAVCAVMGV